MSRIVEGNTIEIHYTGTLTDGTQFDTTEDLKPFKFVVGSNEVIPGLNEIVMGMDVGETKTATIPCDKAYGQRKEDRILTIDRDKIPAEVDVKVGGVMKMRSPKGTVTNMRVVHVASGEVTLDANHPLAGRDLVFEIEIISIAA